MPGTVGIGADEIPEWLSATSIVRTSLIARRVRTCSSSLALFFLLIGISTILVLGGFTADLQEWPLVKHGRAGS